MPVLKVSFLERVDCISRPIECNYTALFFFFAHAYETKFGLKPFFFSRLVAQFVVFLFPGIVAG